ncbi:MAG: hypothetical protein ACKPKO_64795 [Candidatus Fonsibacter sp.]
MPHYPALRSGMEVGGLVGTNDERAGATQQFGAPLFQDFNWRSVGMSRGVVAMAACIISSVLMASNAPRLSNGRLPGFNETYMVWASPMVF